MANIKSQKKRNRQNERRRERNKAVRTELKTRVKVANTAVVNGADDATEQVQTAQKRINKAASAGIIHKNQAARRTSRHDEARPRRGDRRRLSRGPLLSPRRLGAARPRERRRLSAARRATSTSIAVRSSRPLCPRRSSSACASKPSASRSPSVPSRRAASSGNRAPFALFMPSTAAACSLVVIAGSSRRNSRW